MDLVCDEIVINYIYMVKLMLSFWKIIYLKTVSAEQICSYNNGEGLNYIMQVATMLLNPMSNEFTATFVGRLIITIVTKAGNMLGDNIQLLLKAVISKLQLVESLNVVMSLVMTFAHLIITQMDAVLNFLSTVPGPTGASFYSIYTRP